MSTDGESGDDSVLLPGEVNFYRYNDELGSADTAAVMTTTGQAKEANARGCGWQFGRRCARMVEEARSSLRGRRLFTLFAVVNLVNYLDRGVIPGGSEEFDAFIRQNLRTHRPDVFLGILQSAFILGFSVACLIFARLARSRSPFTLMGVGLGVWCFSSVLAGLSRPLSSYSFLLLARLLSGIGEASFVTVVPPLITETAPPGERGMWLALFYTAQPVGAGLGYVYGSIIATSRLGWQWAFYLEALMMSPLALACSLVPKDRATTAANAADYGASSGPDSRVSSSRVNGSRLNRSRLNGSRLNGSRLNGSCVNGSRANVASNSGISDKAPPPLPVEQDNTSTRQHRLAASTPSSEGLGDARRRRMDKGAAGVAGMRPDDPVEGFVGGEGPRHREGGLKPAEMSLDTIKESLVEGIANRGRGGGGSCSRRHGVKGMAFGNRSWSSCEGREDDDQGSGDAAHDVEPLLDQQKHATGWDSEKGFSASLSGGAYHGMEGDSDGVEGLEGDHDEDEGNYHHQHRQHHHHHHHHRQTSSANTGAVSFLPFGEGEEGTQAGPPQEVFLMDDVFSVLDRSVFCLVVLGAAATAAVTAGMSTFGTGFVTSLEFLSSETAAAATFGGVICAAGLAGTPAGGALIDAADPEGRMGTEKKLVVVLTQATALMCSATVLIIAATAQSSLTPFLIFFFLGGSLLFATTAHANLAVMLSAPKHLRPLSLAVNSIALHAFGDVPSPTIVGALKDTFAPHCAESGGVGGDRGIGKIKSVLGTVFSAVGEALGVPVDAGDDGGGVEEGRWEGGGGRGEKGGVGVVGDISDACRGERRGLHLTLFFVSSWLLWTCLFFSLARAVQQAALVEGVAPVSWGDIGCLVSRGLFRPAWTRPAAGLPPRLSRRCVPWRLCLSIPSFRKWWGGRRPASTSLLDLSADDVGSNLEQALLVASPQSSSDGSFLG